MSNYRKWSKEEEIILRESHQNRNMYEVKELLPYRSKAQIQSKIERMGIKFLRKVRAKNPNPLCAKCEKELSMKEKSYCAECTRKYNLIRRYERDFGITMDFNMLYETYSIEEWYEFTLSDKINRIPIEINNKENWIKIIRYVALQKLNMSRKDILRIDTPFIKQHKMTTALDKLDSKLYCLLDICFPEHNILPWEMSITSWNFFDDPKNIVEAIDWMLNKNNLSIQEIYYGDFNLEKLLSDNGLTCLCLSYFKGVTPLFDWYCEQKRINLTKHDKKHKKNGYWKSKENFIIQFKRYVEYLLEEDYIINPQTDFQFYLSNTVLENTGHIMLYEANVRNGFYNSLFHCFIETYPEYGLSIEDFLIIGCDGKSVLNSYREKIVFDFIHNKMNIKTIQAIGMSKNNGYYNAKYNERYFPDFAITEVNEKPIIIEFYGLYAEKDSNEHMLNNYKEKTKRKNEFFRNRKDIFFIDLYNQDLDDDCIGIRNKINEIILN